MESKTAIQLAIEKIQKENMGIFAEFMKDDGTKEAELSSESNGLLTAIRILKSLLPTEKEQIEQAYKCGYIEGFSENEYTSTLITEYFTNTYGQTKND